MWLLVVAAFGFLVPNGFFIHWLLTGHKSLDAVLGNELALGFILDCTLTMVLLAWLFAVRPPGRVRWPWFVGLSLAGGLAFSIPLYLWLNRRLSADPKEGFSAWWPLGGGGAGCGDGDARRVAVASAELRPFTLDDEMALRTLNDDLLGGPHPNCSAASSLSLAEVALYRGPLYIGDRQDSADSPESSLARHRSL